MPNDYIESQAKSARPIRNNELVCKDCKFRLENAPTAYCQIFKKGDRMKPDAVLLGHDCPEYQEE